MTYYFPSYGGWHAVPWEQGAPMARAVPRRGLAAGAGVQPLQRGEGKAHPHRLVQLVASCHPQQGHVWGLSPCCGHPRDKDARCKDWAVSHSVPGVQGWGLTGAQAG